MRRLRGLARRAERHTQLPDGEGILGSGDGLMCMPVPGLVGSRLLLLDNTTNIHRCAGLSLVEPPLCLKCPRPPREQLPQGLRKATQDSHTRVLSRELSLSAEDAMSTKGRANPLRC